jgi:hypothetical protein
MLALLEECVCLHGRLAIKCICGALALYKPEARSVGGRHAMHTSMSSLLLLCIYIYIYIYIYACYL